MRGNSYGGGGERVGVSENAVGVPPLTLEKGSDNIFDLKTERREQRCRIRERRRRGMDLKEGKQGRERGGECRVGRKMETVGWMAWREGGGL